MPLITFSNYKSSILLFNGHLQTIYPALTRKVSSVKYIRERIDTPDDDFLDLDWSPVNSRSLVIVCHGLEGNSLSPYMKGMIRAFNQHKIDGLAWNFRGCSEEMNRQRRFYHSGATDDLEVVIKHVQNLKKYEEIYLVGFSLGGNLILKYLGEKGESLDSEIKKAVVFSVPLHLYSSCQKISAPDNFIYSRRFLFSLVNKIKTKAKIRNDLNIEGIHRIKNLKEFDDRYTAPLHGFSDALQYYESCSAINFLDKITVETLIVNAKNDPFLSEDCFPVDMLDTHPYVYFEIPDQGGHVGFYSFANAVYWSEKRALDFIQGE